MDAEGVYAPPPEFQELTEDSLVDIDLNDSTELWLIQLPEDTPPDFDGQELTLELNQDGQLGSLEGSSGKVYNMVSYSSQQSDAMVFVASPSGPRIVGKIKQHVSLVHYLEPDELKAIYTNQKQMPRSSMTYTHSAHHLSTPSRSMSKRSSHQQSRSRSTHTSRRSGLSDVGNLSKPSKRTAGEPSRYSDQSGRDSGKSVTTFSGSSEQSHRKKSKQETD